MSAPLKVVVAYLTRLSMTKNLKEMKEMTKAVKIVDMVAVLVALGYGVANAPAQASKFVKKMNKKVGRDEGGRYLPEDMYEDLVKEMKDSKSKYDWSKAKPVYVEANEMVEKVETRAAQLRAELNTFYKSLPKTMPVETLTISLGMLIDELKENFPEEESTKEEK